LKRRLRTRPKTSDRDPDAISAPTMTARIAGAPQLLRVVVMRTRD
jgi:hypothetical protein